MTRSCTISTISFPARSLGRDRQFNDTVNRLREFFCKVVELAIGGDGAELVVQASDHEEPVFEIGGMNLPGRVL